MIQTRADPKIGDAKWQSLYTVGGVGALLAWVLFLAALVDLILTGLAGTVTGWLSLFADNWLVVLFKLNAGFNTVPYTFLYGLNPLDVAILALVGTMYIGLYAVLRKTSKIWSFIAAIQPFLGIVLYMATGIAGRCGVMGAGFVISLVMLRSDIFGKAIACLGLVASVLLLAGDVGTTPGAASSILALLIGVGYVLLTAWFILIGQRLLLLGQALTPSLREQGRVW